MFWILGTRKVYKYQMYYISTKLECTSAKTQIKKEKKTCD